MAKQVKFIRNISDAVEFVEQPDFIAWQKNALDELLAEQLPKYKSLDVVSHGDQESKVTENPENSLPVIEFTKEFLEDKDTVSSLADKLYGYFDVDLVGRHMTEDQTASFSRFNKIKAKQDNYKKVYDDVGAKASSFHFKSSALIATVLAGIKIIEDGLEAYTQDVAEAGKLALGVSMAGFMFGAMLQYLKYAGSKAQAEENYFNAMDIWEFEKKSSKYDYDDLCAIGDEMQKNYNANKAILEKQTRADHVGNALNSATYFPNI